MHLDNKKKIFIKTLDSVTTIIARVNKKWILLKRKKDNTKNNKQIISQKIMLNKTNKSNFFKKWEKIIILK